MADIAELTDRQIAEIYGWKDPATQSGEPESEDDVRNWCLETAALQGADPEVARKWADHMVEVWRGEKAATAERLHAFEQPET